MLSPSVMCESALEGYESRLKKTCRVPESRFRKPFPSRNADVA